MLCKWRHNFVVFHVRVWAATKTYNDGGFLEHVLRRIWLSWNRRKATFLLWFQVFERSFYMHQPVLDHLLWFATTDHAGIHFDPEFFVQTISGSSVWAGKIFKLAANFCHNQWIFGVVAFVLRHLGFRGEVKEESHSYSSWFVVARTFSRIQMVVSRLECKSSV